MESFDVDLAVNAARGRRRKIKIVQPKLRSSMSPAGAYPRAIALKPLGATYFSYSANVGSDPVGRK